MNTGTELNSDCGDQPNGNASNFIFNLFGKQVVDKTRVDCKFGASATRLSTTVRIPMDASQSRPFNIDK